MTEGKDGPWEKQSLSIVRTFFWASAGTIDFSLITSLCKRSESKRSETLILPLVIKSCPECCFVKDALCEKSQGAGVL